MNSLLAVIQLLLISPTVYTPETVPVDAGTYPVVIEYSDGEQTVSEVIQFTVITTKTVIEETVAIVADDFNVGENAVLNDEVVITQSAAKAWNITTGEEYEIEKVEIFYIDETQYQAMLYSFQGIKTKININVEKDYDKKIVIKEDFGTFGKDNGVLSKYGIQNLEIFLAVPLLILIVILIIRKYNKLIDKLSKGLEEAKEVSQK